MSWATEAEVTPNGGTEIKSSGAKDESDKLTKVYPIRISERINKMMDVRATALCMTKQQYIRKLIHDDYNNN